MSQPPTPDPQSPPSVAPDAVIRCAGLELGAGVVIEERVRLAGGRLRIGPGCRIRAGTTINVRDEFTLGPRSVCGPDALIEGRHITIGRELWTGPQVRIGGGACFEIHSRLVAGYWLHLGMRAFINTARSVTIGNEVGIGTASAIYTHGVYQSPLAGFPTSFAPVSIGDNCWLPGAAVNPGVAIGPNAVIAVGSVVTRDIPAGALAGGVPCRVIKEGAFPRALSSAESLSYLQAFIKTAAEILADNQLPARDLRLSADGFELAAGDTRFDFQNRTISGPADARSEKIRDLLRRHGIRFFAEVADGAYRDWRQDAGIQ